MEKNEQTKIVEKFLDYVIYDLQDEAVLREVEKSGRTSYTVSSCFFDYVVDYIDWNAIERDEDEDDEDCAEIREVPDMYKRSFVEYIEKSLAGSWTHLMEKHLPTKAREVYEEEMKALRGNNPKTHKEKALLDLESSYDLLFELRNNYGSGGRYTFSMRDRTLIIKNPTEFNTYEIGNWVTFMETDGRIKTLGKHLVPAFQDSLGEKEWNERLDKVRDTATYEGGRGLQVLENHLCSDSFEVELKDGREYILDFAKGYFNASILVVESQDHYYKKEDRESIENTYKKARAIIAELESVPKAVETKAVEDYVLETFI